MKNLVIVFGGRSVEHEISILTGLHAARHVMDGYRVHMVYMTRDNKFVTGRALVDIDFYQNKKGKVRECWFGDGNLVTRSFFGVRRIPIHAVINCCHGGVGEDGRLAAAFDVAGIPITSSAPQTSAELMSKIATRNRLVAEGFVQPKFFAVESVDQMIPEDFGFPAIVKPDKLGSSIGITVVKTAEDLGAAIELALLFGKTAIVEEFVVEATEINCAAFCYGDRVMTSHCEIITKDEDGGFLDFDKKYLDSSSGFVKKTKGKPKELTPEMQGIIERVGEMTRNAYQIFGCSGVVRCDFLVRGEEVFLNEINTVPGFLGYHLWAQVGIPYGMLLDRMVKQATNGARELAITDFKSNILERNRGLVER